MAQRPIGDADAATDLPVDVQARIRTLLDRVEADVPYYDYFDLPRDADRKAIKRAYYALAALVHPDRHAGRTLGPWKARMEELFRILTSAHDTLSNPAQRELYDRLLPPEEPRDVAPAPSAAPVSATVAVTPPRATPITPAPITPQPTTAGSTVPPVSARTLNEAQRREALARRLRAGRVTLTGMTSKSAPHDASAPPAPTPETLRAEAEAQEARGDFTAAWKTWRQLAALLPADHGVLKRQVRALLNARDVDLHLAADLSKRVIGADPRDVDAHLLLADVYLAAHLPAAARSVLEHAKRTGLLDPALDDKLAKINGRPSRWPQGERK